MKKQLLLIGLSIVLAMPLVKSQVDPDKVFFYLPFEDNFVDGSTKGINFLASTSAEATGTITYVAGKFGKAAKFNLSPIVSQNLNFNPVNSFSVSAWVNMTELPFVIGSGQTWIHQKDVTGMNAGRIHLEVLKDNYFGSFTSGKRCDDTTANRIISTNTWYHVAHVNDVSGGSRKFYVNGVLVSVAAIGAESNNGQLVIGGPKQETAAAMIKAGGSGDGGIIDDLLMTSQVLDQATITKIMNDGVQASFTVTGSKSINISEMTCHYNNGTLFTNNCENGNVKIYNISGQKLDEFRVSASEKSFGINLKKGMYIAEITSGSKTGSLKFLVQ